MKHCKICDIDIEDKAWFSHVEAHKRKYLFENGYNPNKFSKVLWEDVIKFYNPSLFIKKDSYQQQLILGDFRTVHNNKKNENCKIADSRKIFFDCSKDCKFYTPPDMMTKKKGLMCLHQKNSRLNLLYPK